MNSPFQSIKDPTQNQPSDMPTHASAERPPSVDDLISDLFAKRQHNSSANFDGPDNAASLGQAQSSCQPLPLTGGVHEPSEAIERMNSCYFIGKSKEETAVFRINRDGSATVIPSEEFKLEVQNIFVKGPGNTKPVPIEKFWKESSARNERRLVFKPGGTTEPHEYNLWRGFGIEPRKGGQKQRRFVRHLFEVICRRDKKKFKYLMRLFAWFVQNPDKQAGVVLVLKSREEGTGKSTVGYVLLKIFGQHGLLVDDKERLLGRFTDHLETACFILAEEILFAGDLKSADKMKSMITSDVLQIEGKYRKCRQVQNHMKVVATTNHDHAVAAGVRDRRNVVFDVGNERVGDRNWFNALYRDLDDGGTSEFLWLLQNLKLGDWHPRQIIKTDETAQQQRMSGDAISQWCQSCVMADAIIGFDGGVERDLGALVAFADLQSAYTGFCKRTGQRPIGPEAFGRACTDMFGPRSRLAAGAGSKRPWGYHVPIASKWQQEVNKRLGL
jgi:hypothetical protein